MCQVGLVLLCLFCQKSTLESEYSHMNTQIAFSMQTLVDHDAFQILPRERVQVVEQGGAEGARAAGGLRRNLRSTSAVRRGTGAIKRVMAARFSHNTLPSIPACHDQGIHLAPEHGEGVGGGVDGCLVW